MRVTNEIRRRIEIVVREGIKLLESCVFIVFMILSRVNLSLKVNAN